MMLNLNSKSQNKMVEIFLTNTLHEITNIFTKCNSNFIKQTLMLFLLVSSDTFFKNFVFLFFICNF